ncbi:MAG: MraY family glycosyltransferase [candidate division Zixibacteria bacterium]
MSWRIPAYVLVSFLSAYLTFLLIPPIKAFCEKRGITDKPGPRKIHSYPIPRLGGVSFVIAFTVSVWLGFIANSRLWFDNWVGVTGILLGGIVIFVLGLLDDLKNLSPVIKFSWQIFAALIPILCGVRMEFLNIPYYEVINLGFWGIPLSVLWIVAITNTFNLLDGLDGLASGIGAISALTFVVLGASLNLPLASLLAAGILGVCVGFIKFNFYPAQIFMGDSGALFIGYILGVLSLLWPKSYASLVMFVPLLALGLPIIEVLTTTFRRLLTGKKIYVADKRHLFHYLLESGFSHAGVVIFFYIISLQFSIMAVGFVFGKANIILVLEAVFIIFIAIFLSRKLKAGGGNG